MPFDVEMPDGTIISDVPDGTPKEQIFAKYQAMQGGAKQQPTQEPAKQRSFIDELGRQIGLTARAGYEAFTSPAAAVLEAGRTAYNLGAEALGSQSRLPSIYEEQRKTLTNTLNVPEPVGTLERAVNLGAQSMASTGAAAKALPNVPAFAADLGRQIPASGVAGLVSQPVAEIVKDITGSDLAAMLASAGAGAVGAAGTGKAISAAQQAKTPLYTMAEVKQRATKAYNTMDEAGVVLKPTSTKNLLNNIETALDEARMVKGSDQAKALTDVLNQAKSTISNEGVSFNAFEKIRGYFNDLKGNKDGDVRRLGGVAVNKIDDYLSNLTGKDIIAGEQGLDKAVQSVMSARKDWRNMSRASVLDDALNVAEVKALDPKASESELIRRGFINIAANKDKMKLFSTEEQNLIKSVAKGGPLDPLLSTLARFSPLRSQLVAAGSLPAYTQMPTATALAVGGGLLADVTQGALRSRAAQQAVKQIASGAVQPQAPSLAYRGLLSNPLINPESLLGQ